MLRSRVILGIVAVALLVSPLLAACGVTATPTAGATSAPTAAPATVPATKAPTSAPTTAPTAVPTKAGPKPGGSFAINFNQEPDTLDSLKTSTGTSMNVLSWVGATLLAYHPATGQPTPYLAESYKASDDGLTWTFILRKGIKFQDGNPVTAKDFVYTFQRGMDPATKSPQSYWATMSEVSAPDDSTFVVKLKNPFFPLLEVLCMSTFQPQSKAAVEKGGDTYGRSPVGCGPYTFKQWVAGQSVTLSRNPDYKWAPQFSENQGAVYPDTLVYRFITEPGTVLAAVQNDEFDVSMIRAQDDKAVEGTGRHDVIQTLRDGMPTFPMMNLGKPPFDDLKVRQAFAYAMNRDEAIKLMYPNGGAQPQYGVISPSTAGYSKDAEQYTPKFDLAKGQALLAEAGYIKGASGFLEKDGQPLKVVLQCTTSQTSVTLGQILVSQWQKLGIDISLQQLEVTSMITGWKAGNYQMGLNGWGGVGADVMYNWHSSGIGGLNWQFCNDPDLDKLLDLTRTSVDPAKRQQYVNEAQAMMAQKVYALPLATTQDYWAVSKRVTGLQIRRWNSITVNDVYIVSK